MLASKYLRDVVAHCENLEIHQSRKGARSSYDGDIDPNISRLVNVCLTGYPRSGAGSSCIF